VQAISAGAGFTLVLLLMAGIREKLELANVPKPFRGLPIAFIIAGLGALVSNILFPPYLYLLSPNDYQFSGLIVEVPNTVQQVVCTHTF